MHSIYILKLVQSDQSRIKVFGGPRIDTIVGPHTPSSLPSSFDSVNLTGLWGITIEKCLKLQMPYASFTRRNQVKIS